MQRDAAILAQDPLLLGEMLSDEADRMAEAQAAYVGPGVGLDGGQQARLTELLKEAYAEAHAQGLNKRAKPTEEAKIRAWDEAREQLNRRTVDKIKAGLSPPSSGGPSNSSATTTCCSSSGSARDGAWAASARGEILTELGYFVGEFAQIETQATGLVEVVAAPAAESDNPADQQYEH
jgi:hypothetical protein